MLLSVSSNPLLYTFFLFYCFTSLVQTGTVDYCAQPADFTQTEKESRLMLVQKDLDPILRCNSMFRKNNNLANPIGCPDNPWPSTSETTDTTGSGTGTGTGTGRGTGTGTPMNVKTEEKTKVKEVPTTKPVPFPVPPPLEVEETLKVTPSQPVQQPPPVAEAGVAPPVPPQQGLTIEEPAPQPHSSSTPEKSFLDKVVDGVIHKKEVELQIAQNTALAIGEGTKGAVEGIQNGFGAVYDAGANFIKDPIQAVSDGIGHLGHGTIQAVKSVTCAFGFFC